MSLLFTIFMLTLMLSASALHGARNVTITLLETAPAKGAVCLDGSAPAYAYSPGFGDGADNWHVYLQAGGWCETPQMCFERSQGFFGSSTVLLRETNGTQRFDGMLEDNSTFNPYFHNWNVFYIFYCDGSSFMSDVEEVDPVYNISYRGARIYDVMMEELLQMGMGNAKNALLSGSSAGGLATILHCDKFRALFSNYTRVKCLSDSGFFLRGEHFLGADFREERYFRVVSTHRLENVLPTSCTTKFSPTLCYFPENLVPDVQTPLFLLESAFDRYQVTYNIFRNKDRNSSWKKCSDLDLSLCNSTEQGILKDFGSMSRNTIKRAISNSPSSRIGYYVHSCYLHTHMERKGSSTCSILLGNNVLANKTIAQAVGTWYFDKTEFQEMDDQTTLPRNCSYQYGPDTGPDFDEKCSYALQHKSKGVFDIINKLKITNIDGVISLFGIQKK